MCRNNRELRDINMVETILKDQGSKFVNCALRFMADSYHET
jgi:hypothetical protein